MVYLHPLYFMGLKWLDASQVLRSLLYFAACQEGYILICPSL